MELQGEIKKIFEMQTFASGYQKREVILVTDEQYPQPISIEFLSDKIDLLDKFNPGDKAKIFINIRGRSWDNPQGETKYFNSIVGWKIELLETGKKPKEKEPDDHANISWLED